jgi:hypothetical protein
MGTTNYGDQTITFDFLQEATAEGFNKLAYELIPSGIYSGGLLTRSNDITAILAPFTCFAVDATRGIGVRVQTASSVTASVSSATPYIVGRFVWLDVESNYMDVMSVSEGDLLSTDIIFGRAVYESTTMQSAFDYSQRSFRTLDNVENAATSFKVTPSDPYDMTVNISSGEAIVNGVYIDYAGGSATLDAVVGNRVDALVLTDAGAIQILKGDGLTTPLIPLSSLGLALITLTGGKAYISGDMINSLNRVKSNIGYDEAYEYYGSSSTYLSGQVGSNTSDQLNAVGLDMYTNGATLAKIKHPNSTYPITDFKQANNITFESGLHWYSIARINNGQNQAFGYFTVSALNQADSGGVTAKFLVSIKNTTSITVTPISYSGTILAESMQVRVVYYNTAGTTRGAILQVGINTSSTLATRYMEVAVEENWKGNGASGGQWELTTLGAYNDSPSLPDGTIFASTVQFTKSLYASIITIPSFSYDYLQYETEALTIPEQEWTWITIAETQNALTSKNISSIFTVGIEDYGDIKFSVDINYTGGGNGTPSIRCLINSDLNYTLAQTAGYNLSSIRRYAVRVLYSSSYSTEGARIQFGMYSYYEISKTFKVAMESNFSFGSSSTNGYLSLTTPSINNVPTLPSGRTTSVNTIEKGMIAKGFYNLASGGSTSIIPITTGTIGRCYYNGSEFLADNYVSNPSFYFDRLYIPISFRTSTVEIDKINYDVPTSKVHTYYMGGGVKSFGIQTFSRYQLGSSIYMAVSGNLKYNSGELFLDLLGFISSGTTTTNIIPGGLVGIVT